MDQKSAEDLCLTKNSIRSIAHDVTGRISDEALVRIAFEEERRIKEKVRLASVIADRAGRKTVMEEDVLVVEEILESGLE
jgi:histone H3/H4